MARTYQAYITLITMGHLASAAEALEAIQEIIKHFSVHEKKILEKHLEETATALKERGVDVEGDIMRPTKISPSSVDLIYLSAVIHRFSNGKCKVS